MKKMLLLIGFVMVGCVAIPKKEAEVKKTELVYDLFVKHEKEFAFQENVKISKMTPEGVVLIHEKEEALFSKGFIFQRKDVVYPEAVTKDKALIDFSCSFDKYSDEVFYGKDFIKMSEDGVLLVFYSPSKKLEFLVSAIDCKIN